MNAGWQVIDVASTVTITSRVSPSIGMSLASEDGFFGWKVSTNVIDSTDQVVAVTVTSTSADNSSESTSSVRLTHPPQCIIKGITCPRAISETKWQKLNSEVKYSSGDILIVSYPKSGTTWLEQIVLLLLNGGDSSLLNPSHKNTYSPSDPETRGKIWLEACIDQDHKAVRMGEEFRSMSLEEFELMPSPRVIKSHAPSNLLLGLSEGDERGSRRVIDESPLGMNEEDEGDKGNEGDGGGKGDMKGISNRHPIKGVSQSPLVNIPPGVKVIVVSRNPLDSCVSRYYHAFNPYECGWSFPAWAALWLSGHSSCGSWFRWVRGWHERYKRNLDQNQVSEKNLGEILWVKYEDMKRRPHEEIKRIQLFLNIVSDDEELVNKVYEGCSFDNMKRQAIEKEASAECSLGSLGGSSGHLRKGITGDWRNHFSEEMKNEFMDVYHRELEGTGLVYDFGETER